MKKIIPIIIALVAIVATFTVILCTAEAPAEASADYSADGGRVFRQEDRLIFSEVIAEMPNTIATTIKFPVGTNTESIILSNYDSGSKQKPNTFYFYINKSGAPVLCVRYDSTDANRCDHIFSDVNVYTGEWVDLAIVRDGSSLHCYVDGTLAQTVDYIAPEITMTRELFLGGDYRSSRGNFNAIYFKGSMKSIALYSDARTAEELVANALDTSDEALVAYYELSGTQTANIIPDLSKNNNEIVRETITGGLELIDNGNNKSKDRYIASKTVSDYSTIEVMLKADAGEWGVVFGNYTASPYIPNSVNLEIKENGTVMYRAYDKDYATNSKYNNATFNNVNVMTGEWLHLTVVADAEAEEYRCYVNGELKGTVAMNNILGIEPQKAMMLGRDYRTGGAHTQFAGEVMSVVTYADVRSEREIKYDIMRGPEFDENLLAYYDMTFADGSATIPDRSGNGAHLVNAAKAEDELKVEGEGITIDANTLKYPEKYQTETFPKTVEFTVKINEADAGIQRTVLSNYRAASNEYSYTIRLASGIPRLYIYYNGTKNYLEYRFTGIRSDEICTGEWVNVAIVTDIPNKEFRCYINGEFRLSVSFYNDKAGTLTDEQIDAINFDFKLNSKLNFGATHGTSSAANPFTNGYLKSIVTYSDVRTAEEILGDVYFPGTEDMTAYWDASHVGVYKDILDRSNNFNSMIANNRDTVTYDNETMAMTFTKDKYYETANTLKETPLTLEAMVKFPTAGGGSDAGGKKGFGINNVIFGNYYGKTTSNVLNFGISGSNPAVHVIDHLGNAYKFVFDEVFVNTEYWEHIAITFDAAAGFAYCYQNGVLAQKIAYGGELSGIDWSDNEFAHVLGGDWQSERREYFKRKLGYVALYTDIRSADEIYADAKDGIATDDEGLICYYDCKSGDTDGVIDDSKDGKYNLSLFAPFYEKEEISPDSYDYSFAIVGDTQNLTYSYPTALTTLYDWIVNNAASKKIGFVVGVGDINEKDSDAEWLLSSAEIEKLRDAGIPQSLVCGGVHDSIPQFNKYLPYTEYVAAYEGKVVYGFYDDGTGTYSLSNSFQLITIGGVPYMFLSLEWAPKSGHVAWANEVIAAHPEYNVIISTHAYLAEDGTRFNTWHHATPDGTGTKEAHNGVELWNELVRKHENIVMVIGGHDTSDFVLMSESYGDHGNKVVELMINPQHTDIIHGGTGMVAMLYFSNGGRTVNLEYYSTVREMHYGKKNQFSFEMPVVSTDEAHINQASVSVGNSINVNYYAHLVGKYADSVMRITVAGKTYTVSGVQVSGTNKYRFTFEGIAPHMMGENITAELVFNGEVVATKSDFSVANYAKALLKLDKYELAYTAEQTSALHELLASILNYGAEAQKYKEYNAENLVNAGVPSNDVFNAENVVSVKGSTTPVGDFGVKFVGATVRFDNVNSLRFDFTVGSANLDEITVKIGNKSYTKADFIDNGDGKYSVYSEAIYAVDFADAYTAEIFVANESTHSVTYSINSYVKAMHENAKIGELAKAIYFYGLCSEGFISAFSAN